MSSNRTVELHFIDGPLQGTRKMEDESIILRNRAYRYLQPTRLPSIPEKELPSATDLKYLQVVCIEWMYIPIPIPSTYGGQLRFVMCLEKGLGH